MIAEKRGELRPYVGDRVSVGKKELVVMKKDADLTYGWEKPLLTLSDGRMYHWREYRLLEEDAESVFMQKTLDHIRRVEENLRVFSKNLLDRGVRHDNSKFSHEERDRFIACTPVLERVQYGTPEYDQAKAELGDALKHHYENNDHHPEHHESGITGMNLLQLVEMFLDWEAATHRMKDGDLEKSIEHNQQRFSISPDLVQILKNTARDLFPKTTS